MDDMLLLRLNLLVDSGEIDEGIRTAVIDFIKNIESSYSIEIIEDNGAMLVSHLAMALGRIKRGEEIQSIDEEIFKEVKETETYKELDRFYLILEKSLDIQMPQTEKDYIALHLCALIQNS